MKSFKIIINPAVSNYPIEVLKKNSLGAMVGDVSVVDGGDICEVSEGNEGLLNQYVLLPSTAFNKLVSSGWAYETLLSQTCSKCTKYRTLLCKLYE